MRLLNFLTLMMVMVAGTAALAQMPTYNVGRAPTKEEIQTADIIAGPSGKELPPGKGTAQEGEGIFMKKCVACHGKNGEGSKIAPQLIGKKPLHPFATTIWSFINSAMPRSMAEIGVRDGTLSPDEVYALTAYLLYKDGVIQESDVMDAKSLPRVHMPTRDRRLDKLVPR